MWTCFSCQEKGNIYQLYRRLDKEISYDLRIAQAKSRAEQPIITSRNFSAKANACIRSLQSSKVGQRMVRDFLDSRGIYSDAVSAFGLGYDEERDAIFFPYSDIDGRVTGIKYRYRNGFKASEPNSHYGLYGVNHALGKAEVIICEGESDTLSTWSRYHDEYGVCGTSGASVSDTQWSRFGLHLLFARRIYLLYDADEAGDKCAEIAMRVLGTDKCVRLRPSDECDASEFFLSGGTLEALGLEGIDSKV